MTDNSSGDTKPLTFDSPDLKWSDDTPAAATPPVAESTATDATGAPPPADATTPPPDAAPSPDAVAPPEGGPIPLERHKAILEAQRAESDAKWKRVEWADALVNAGKTQEQVRDALGLFDGLDNDFVGTLDRLFRVADQHPDLQAHVRSLAGRWLGTGHAPVSPQGPTQDDAEPQPDFQDAATGRPFMSVERQREWSAWRERQFEKRVDEKYRPLVDAHHASQNRDAAAAEYRRQETQITAEFNRYKDKPHFAENKAAILDVLKASNFTVSIADAYNEVLTTKVLPTLNSTAKADTLADLQRQARASSAKPSASAVVTPPNYQKFSDIPRDKW